LPEEKSSLQDETREQKIPNIPHSEEMKSEDSSGKLDESFISGFSDTEKNEIRDEILGYISITDPLSPVSLLRDLELYHILQLVKQPLFTPFNSKHPLSLNNEMFMDLLSKVI
jgi:hypothetical protein